jgi:hypothetical protein
LVRRKDITEQSKRPGAVSLRAQELTWPQDNTGNH